MTNMIYFNSFIYYTVVIVCPVAFVGACGEPLNNTTHIIYALYSIWTLIFESYSVLKIQKKINNHKVLEFNKWHVVELIMGQIARFDTYLDVCFLCMLW